MGCDLTPEVSIVLTAHNRSKLLRKTLESIRRQRFSNYEIVVVEDGSDQGWTCGVAEEFGARYFQRKNRPDVLYSNPSIPINIGLRHAEGEIVILQNAECLHASDEVIDALAAPHRADPKLAVFASVSARHANGEHWHWYVHPKLDCGQRPFFFCGSVRREHFWRLRGMDEGFVRYGYEDDDWALRMTWIGLRFQFLENVIVHHQWHPGTNCDGIQTNAEIWERKLRAMAVGEIGPERNIDRGWGSLDS